MFSPRTTTLFTPMDRGLRTPLLLDKGYALAMDLLLVSCMGKRGQKGVHSVHFMFIFIETVSRGINTFDLLHLME